MLALPAIIVQSADFNAFVETLNAYKELGFENPSWYFFSGIRFFAMGSL
jgi:hypothetical protein